MQQLVVEGKMRLRVQQRAKPTGLIGRAETINATVHETFQSDSAHILLSSHYQEKHSRSVLIVSIEVQLYYAPRMHFVISRLHISG